MEKAVRFFKSYVICRFWGPDTVRFLNMCRYNGIRFFSVSHEDGSIRAALLVEDFRRIRKPARKTHTRACVLEKKGFRFLMYRYRKRRGFFAGAAVFLVCMAFLTSRIWAFEFEGNFRYTDERLTKYLESRGIVPGLPVKAVSGSELEEDIRLTFPDISWVSAQTTGSVLTIRLEEMLPERNTDQESKPASLVAAFDGEIVSMVTRSGTPIVGTGQNVSAGDVLIDGYEQLKNDMGEVTEERYVGADGDVYGKVTEIYEKTYPAVTTAKRYGPSRPRYDIRLGSRGFCLSFGLPKEDFDIFCQVYTPFPKLFPWFSIQENLYRRYETVPVITSLTELKEKALSELQAYLDKCASSGIQIFEDAVSIEVGTETVQATGRVTMIRSIGQASQQRVNPNGS